MVDAALLHDEAMLAFQPIVTSSKPHTIVLYEGLIRIPDPTGRIIPAGEFIHKVEELETGRLIDCKVLEIGLRTLARQPQLHLSINMSETHPFHINSSRRTFWCTCHLLVIT